mmetsp:Transcript_21619/g.38721  ORF Transcript_21619/g.38721 Transcript_21619/m.38721 type:complete len:314 (+) Transcript_21619:159-1100(+)
MWLTTISPMMLLLGALLLLGGSSTILAPAVAFSPSHEYSTSSTRSPRISVSNKTWQNRPAHVQRWISPPRDVTALFESNDDDEQMTETETETTTNYNDNIQTSNSLFQRFLSPKIDDPGLPLTDVLLAQIVAPTFQIYWLLLNHAPNPSWLTPISSYFGDAAELAPRGSLLAPTLIHGAGLAVCWLAGALAAKMYERDAFTVKQEVEEQSSLQRRRSATGILDEIGRYDKILVRLFQAGAFASGILIVSTQMDLLLEFKGYVQYGESAETDLRLLVGTVEVINDIFWEALVIGSWRIIHANFMSSPDNRLKRF